MKDKKSFFYALGGFCLGVLLTSMVWIAAGQHQNLETAPSETMAATLAENQNPHSPSNFDERNPEAEGESNSGSTLKPPQTGQAFGTEDSSGPKNNTNLEETSNPNNDTSPEDKSGTKDSFDIESSSDTEGSTSPEDSSNTWDRNAIYTGGDTVSYQGRRYKAKWWTQGEIPGSSDVWEDLNIVDGEVSQPEGVANTPVNADVPHSTELMDFKVVGYYPSWKPDNLQFVDFGILTHVCYAFAIPTTDGNLLDLENPDTAQALIHSAHENGAKVLLSVGGWSYNDTPLENTFMEATSNEEKTERFAENILAMCEKYGFDGVDMDWEHPRVDGTSAKQYEALMTILSERLHAQDKLLTAAVLSGATADGNIYYDAAAHTNAVLNAVDFINVMAYDGGDGERHSAYDFAVDCGVYWKETRGLPAYKVVLGVPFYARPSWAGYGTILEAVPDADRQDHVSYNGMDVYYNGVDTIAQKTAYAKENLGGIMIWELTQDTSDRDKSLLQTIGQNAE